MVLTGVFYRYPNLQVIVGHWGEVVLFYLDRIAQLNHAGLKLERPIADYFKQNFYYTPSGIFSQQYFSRTIEIVGVERMMFSQDWPYQSCGEKGARTFLEQASLSDAEKEAIAHGNWSGLLMAYGVIQMMKQEVRKAMTSIEERLKTLEDEHQIRAPTNSFADICLSGNAQQFEALWIECGQPHCD